MGLSDLCNAMIATYLQQGDLFASPRPAAPAAAPRISVMTSSLPPAPIAPEGPALPPKSVTSDPPCLVVDGIKNQTYHIE